MDLGIIKTFQAEVLLPKLAGCTGNDRGSRSLFTTTC